MQDASRYEVTTPPVPERVVKLDDRESSLEGVIDSTARGPAAGGCRIWTYPDRASAHREALRLAAGMSYKNALAELPLGSGKAVIMAPEGSIGSSTRCHLSLARSQQT